MGRTYKTCFFCNRNDSPLTREHVFPRWIVKEFTNADVWDNVNVGPRPFKSHHEIGQICKKVCKRCNTGWMSKLESKARPILGPMIRGSAATLTPVEQTIITRWFLKIAIMFDGAFRITRRPYLTVSDREAFASSFSIPEDTQAFLAHYVPGSIGDIATRHSDLVPLSEASAPDVDTNLLDVHGFSFTVVIHKLALQIFSFRKPKDVGGKWVMPSKWNEAQTIIWPLGIARDRWPPRLALDDRAFEEFAKRWGDLSLMS